MLNIALYSNKWGELPVTQQFPHAPPGVVLPGAQLQVAAAPDNRYYYLFQQFNVGQAVVMSCRFFSSEKDTIMVTTNQPVTIRLTTRHSHRYTTRSFNMQIFHERNYNCFYLPRPTMEYQVEAGADFSFIDILIHPDYLQSLAIPADTLQDFMAKVNRRFAAKLSPRKQVASIELLRWIDELTEWMAATDKPVEDGETIVHQLVKRGVSGLVNTLLKTPLLKDQQEVNKIYKAAAIIQNSDEYFTLQHIPELASQVELSKYKLKVLFEHIYGYSILKHQSEEKMRLALRLVANSELTEKVVSDMLGYSCIQSFSRKYKHRFGHPPYRLNRNK